MEEQHFLLFYCSSVSAGFPDVLEVFIRITELLGFRLAVTVLEGQLSCCSLPLGNCGVEKAIV